MAETFPTPHPLSHLTAVARGGRAPGELWYPNGVAIDRATNHIFIAEGDGIDFGRVSIFSESGEYVYSFTHKDMKSLYGIAIHGNSVYVTDDELHAVFHLKMEVYLRLVDRLGSRGSGIGQ